MSSDSLVNMMEKYREDYYQMNKKNTFFKKNQKMDCAKEMTQAFNLNEMIKKTVYRLNDSNKVIFNYPIFKLYAHPDNFDSILQGVLNLYDEILLDYPNYEAHIMLEGFTISAAERYKGVIQMFCHKCMNLSTKYSELISAMYIYYTPSMMDNISTLLRPFIDTNVYERIIMFSKTESTEKVRHLFG
jgi:hypothetical protein